MLTILVGKSASGKDAIAKSLIQNEGFTSLVSDTTRPPRPYEVDGVDYNFVSQDNFFEKLKDNYFIEFRSYSHSPDKDPNTKIWLYGLAQQQLEKDKKYVAITDVTGTEELLKYFGKENCFVVSVEAKDKIREERAKGRENKNGKHEFSQSEWDRRLADDKEKFAPIKIDGIYNYKVENNENRKGAIEDITIDILDALDAYEKFSREKGKQYIVQEETKYYSYYEPPETEYKVCSKEDYERKQTEIIRQTFHDTLSEALFGDGDDCDIIIDLIAQTEGIIMKNFDKAIAELQKLYKKEPVQEVQKQSNKKLSNILKNIYDDR